MYELKGEEGEVLDYIQLFNSVEVLAPGIEMDNVRQTSRFRSSGMLFISFHLFFLFLHLADSKAYPRNDSLLKYIIIYLQYFLLRPSISIPYWKFASQIKF